jgi:hypothetical protein
MIRATALIHPLLPEPEHHEFPEGYTLEQVLRGIGWEDPRSASLRVLVDDQVVPKEDWGRAPAPGQRVFVRNTPPGKDVLIWLFPAFGLALGDKPLPLRPPGLLGTEDSPTLRGTRNESRPFEPVPRIFGEWQYKPPYAARPYTEISGGDQYIRLAFSFGFGPLELSDFKIGDTALSQFENVELQWGDGDPDSETFYQELPGPQTPISAVDIYTNDIDVTSFNSVLETGTPGSRQVEDPGNIASKTTAALTDEIILEFTYPEGWYNVDHKGRTGSGPDEFLVKVGGSAATFKRLPPDIVDLGSGRIQMFPGNFTHRGRMFRSITLDPGSSGTHTVTVQKMKSGQMAAWGANSFTKTVWTQLQSVHFTSAFNLPGEARAYLRIKASDQLNGIVDEFNCKVQAKLPAWNGSSFDAATIVNGRKAGWATLEILRGNANARPVLDERIDLDAFKAWVDGGTDKGAREIDAVLDFEESVQEAADRVARVGRGSLHYDGLYSAVIDEEKTPATDVDQHFGLRNTVNYRGSLVYPETLHAFRAQFFNRAKGYERDERIVYDDKPGGGTYDSTTATKFETFDVFGATDEDEVWKDTRRELARRRLRPMLHQFETDAEGLVAQRGSLVLFAGDVPQLGLHDGRIRSLLGTPPNYTGCVIDETIFYDGAKDYRVTIRLADGTSKTEDVNNPGTLESESISFSSPITGIAVGDFVQFNEKLAGMTTAGAEMIVAEIEPGFELGARLTCYDHSPAIYDADTGSIPAWTSNITVGRDAAPAAPLINSYRQTADRLIVVPRLQASFGVQPEFFQLQYRKSDPPTDEWSVMREQPLSTTELETGLLEPDLRYDLRVRTLSAARRGSAFATLDDVLFTGTGIDTPRYEVVGLGLKGRGSKTTFVGRNAHFVWRWRSPGTPDVEGVRENAEDYANTIPSGFLYDFYVRILDADTREEVRGESVGTALEYEYSYQKNADDAAKENRAPRRSFICQVAFRAHLTDVHDVDEMPASNPAPRVPSNFSLQEQLGGIRALFDAPGDEDAMGVLMWSKANDTGFTPGPMNLVVDQPSLGPVFVKATGSPDTHTAYIAIYDVFAKNPNTGEVDTSLLNISDESAEVTIGLVDTPDIEDNAVTVPAAAFTAGPINFPGSSVYTQIQVASISVSTIASPVVVLWFTCEATRSNPGGGGGDVSHFFKITRDSIPGSPVHATDPLLIPETRIHNGAAGSTVAFSVRDEVGGGPPSGTQYWRAWCKVTPSVTTGQVKSISKIVTELQK